MLFFCCFSYLHSSLHLYPLGLTLGHIMHIDFFFVMVPLGLQITCISCRNAIYSSGGRENVGEYPCRGLESI